MGEIKKLEINIKNVKGALTNKGGKSDNVWGQVEFPMEVLKASKKAVESKGKDGKSCIWTAYDPVIYASEPFDANAITPEVLRNRVEQIINEEKGITNRKLWFEICSIAKRDGIDAVMSNSEIMSKVRDIVELEMRGIPTTISATFKSCFSPYSAVFENIGMHIAYALDMPTSYNYLVSFNPKEWPDIVDNYSTASKVAKLQPMGIVSIDFLQNREVPEYEEDMRVRNDEGFWDWITIKKNYKEDGLFSFSELINMSERDYLDGNANLVQNWISASHKVAEPYLENESEDVRSKRLHNMDSRIVRSTILREFLGDADFTAYNGGIVNHNRYAANFDYGESFNGLIKEVLAPEDDRISDEAMLKLPIDVREKLMQIQSKPKKTVDQIARTFASSTGEENLKYIIRHYAEDAAEILANIQQALENDVFDKIVDEYTVMTCNGVPLLSIEEAETLKKYIDLRGEWIVSIAHSMLNDSVASI